MMLRKGLFLMAVALCATMMVPDDLCAQRRGGSRTRASRPTRSVSKPKPAPRRPAKPAARRSGGPTKKVVAPAQRRSGGPAKKITKKAPTKSATKAPTKNWGKKKAAKSTAPKRKMSAADQKLAAKAKKSGKSFTDRKSAVADFKKKNATKYPSAYKAKPTTRPDHIPQTTSVGGRNVNVTFNVDRGGYYYPNSLGALILYSAVADLAMQNRLMARQGYWDPTMRTGAVIATTPVVVHTNSGSGFIWFIVICSVLVVFGFSVWAMRKEAKIS